MGAIEITLLVENTARRRGLLGEHGLAYWIETPSRKILFDTGQGMALPHNAQVCGKRLEEVDTVVLSHGHYDHAGAMQAVLERAPKATVYLHPEALRRRYCGTPGHLSRVDEPFLSDGGLERLNARTVFTPEPVEVAEGLWVTGEVPRLTGFEDTGGAFWLDPEGREEDPIRDDQSLYFRSTRGVVVILGCAHAGVVNTLRQVAALTGDPQIYAVMGGMHLVQASPERLAETYAAFRIMGLRVMAPCHCTGTAAVSGFWSAFPRQCVEAHAGASFRFEAPLLPQIER